MPDSGYNGGFGGGWMGDWMGRKIGLSISVNDSVSTAESTATPMWHLKTDVNTAVSIVESVYYGCLWLRQMR